MRSMAEQLEPACDFNEKDELTRKEFANQPIPYDQEQKDVSESNEVDSETNLNMWPSLDQSALYGLAGDFVQLATENSEADPAAVLATFLTRFGVEVGPGPYFMVGDSKHYPRIFTVIVGASSKARKGTSAKPVESLFDLNDTIESKRASGLDINDTARSSPGPLSSGEGIIYAVRDASQEWKTDPKSDTGHWIVTDPGVDDKRLYIHDEEFASALSCTKREGNTLSAILRNLWDSGSIEPLTKTNKIKATGAHIGICTHITNAELHKKLDETEALNGFANRFLWITAKRHKLVPLPSPMDPGKLFELKERLIESLHSAKKIKRMKFTTNAENMWCDSYRRLTESRPGIVGTVLGRGEAQVIRLSMLYALLDGSELIRTTHLASAMAFWDYCTASAAIIFSNRSEDTTAERIISALQEGPKSKTELFNVFHKRIRGARLDSALRDLISQGRVTQKIIRSHRKPKTVFQIAFKPLLNASKAISTNNLPPDHRFQPAP